MQSNKLKLKINLNINLHDELNVIINRQLRLGTIKTFYFSKFKKCFNRVIIVNLIYKMIKITLSCLLSRITSFSMIKTEKSTVNYLGLETTL